MPQFLMMPVLIFLVGVVPSVSSQDGGVRPLPIEIITNENDRSCDERIIVARQLIRARNFEGASALLETIYESAPSNELAANLLRACYTELKYHEKNETLLRAMADRFPLNYTYRLSLAESLVDQGKIEPGNQEYDRAAELLKSLGAKQYLVIVRSLIAHGQEEKGLKLIERARTESGDSLLFGLEQGTLFEKQRDYRRATLTFLPLTAEDTSFIGIEAEKRLFAMLEFAESTTIVEKTLLENIPAILGGRTAALLAAYYIKAGRYDDAFGFSLRQDSLDNSQGFPLLDFMRQCSERKAYAQVIRMADIFKSRYPDSRLIMEAHFRHADALAGMNHSTEAIAMYQAMLLSPNPQDKAEALYHIGDIQLNKLGDPESALASFTVSIEASKRGLPYLNSRRSVPICHARAGRLDQAQTEWAALAGQKIGGEDMVEEFLYSLALVDFFTHNYDSAETGMRRIIIQHPRGYFVNDCLRQLLIISEAKASPAILNDYADASYFAYRRMTDSASERLERLTNAEDKLLAPVALFDLAQIELNEFDSTNAIGYIDRLVDQFPDAHPVPYGLKIKADILAQDELSRQEAIAIYRQLLESYPNFPYSSDVRKKLRQLNEPLSVG